MPRINPKVQTQASLRIRARANAQTGQSLHFSLIWYQTSEMHIAKYKILDSLSGSVGWSGFFFSFTRMLKVPFVGPSTNYLVWGCLRTNSAIGIQVHTSLNVRNRTFWHVCPTKTQISLRIRAVWSESSLSTWRNSVSLDIKNVPSQDYDQTARTRRLIWIFVGRTCPKVPFLTLRANMLIVLSSSAHCWIWSRIATASTWLRKKKKKSREVSITLLYRYINEDHVRAFSSAGHSRTVFAKYFCSPCWHGAT